MTNPRLEKLIVGLAACLFLLSVIVMLFWNVGRLYSVAGLMAGFALSLFNFFGLTCLYCSMDRTGSRAQTLLTSLTPLLSLGLTLLALFVFNRLSAVLFWCAVAGLFLIPVATIILIITEAFGISHTDFYT